MFEIRAMPADDPVSRELLTAYFAMRAESFPGQYRPTLPERAVFEPPAGVFLVVIDGTRPVGCGGIRRIADGPSGIRYEVKHLYLAPETRGRGWGRRLLEALEERAREWDAGELVLDTHHTLEAAGGLYAASGFAEVEAYNDNPNATRWYAKPL